MTLQKVPEHEHYNYAEEGHFYWLSIIAIVLLVLFSALQQQIKDSNARISALEKNVTELQERLGIIPKENNIECNENKITNYTDYGNILWRKYNFSLWGIDNFTIDSGKVLCDGFYCHISPSYIIIGNEKYELIPA